MTARATFSPLKGICECLCSVWLPLSFPNWRQKTRDRTLLIEPSRKSQQGHVFITPLCCNWFCTLPFLWPCRLPSAFVATLSHCHNSFVSFQPLEQEKTKQGSGYPDRKNDIVNFLSFVPGFLFKLGDCFGLPVRLPSAL